MYKTLHKRQDSVTVQLRFARSSVTFCAKRDSYYNYRYLILARLGKPGERGRYILGVPGHYGNNEKYMAAMFGFDRFVRSTRQPPRDSRFGYWYTDLNFT